MTTPTPLERLYMDPEYWRRFVERLKRHGLERATSFWLWGPPGDTKKGDAP